MKDNIENPLGQRKFYDRRSKTDVENPLGQRKFYYPSLDGLRFFGFLLVFLHHVYQTTYTTNPVGNFFVTIFRTNGWVGVDLFLILSGFLVTTLFLKERAEFGNFSLKNFFLRRALRIWPLYYLALFVGFLAFPLIVGQLGNTHYQSQLKGEFWWYFLFLGNWYTVINDYSVFRNIGLLWTISLEQQFYFVWPFILLAGKGFRSLLIYCLVLIAGAIFLRWVLFQFDIQHPDIYVNTFARMDTLVFGSLLAAVNFYRPSLKKYIRPFLNLPILIGILIIFFLFLFETGTIRTYLVRHSIWGYIVLGLFMGYFIVASLNTRSVVGRFLSQKSLVWLGKISYGLYVWHILAIDLTRFLIGKTPIAFLEPVIALALAIFISWVSYKFFEVKFLKLKDKFTKISSRPI